MTSVSVGQTLWREVGPVCVAYALVGLSFGAITVSAGIPGWVAPLMSATVFAGSAQFAAVGIMLGGGGVLAAMVAGWVINARMLAYGLSMRHALGRGTWRRLVGAHLITDVNTALVLAEPRADSGSERARALVWGAGVSIFVTWNVAVMVGVLVGDGLTDIHALGLDAVLPAILLSLIAKPLRDRRTRACAIGGGVACLAGLWLLPPGWPVLVSLLGCVWLYRPRPRARP